ncbi:phosphogluconate dehydratase [Aurantivibrio plasticivorans]
MSTHPIVEQVTAQLTERSAASRRAYLESLQRTLDEEPPRQSLSCGNFAHGFAACSDSDKDTIRLMHSANIGVVNAYNDMLSAHQPLAEYPALIAEFARSLGSTAQVAGGVPAMCDGVTQGRPGMELSLFSRDVIAMATAISLSHNMFDAALCLGVCDKIVPGLLIGSLQFGHLPCVFFPAGPMPTGISNKEKAFVRQRYVEGKASKEELLATESASYHSAGTCTFYGTANTNQVLMEVMGIQLPGASFVPPSDPLRKALLQETVTRLIQANAPSTHIPLSDVVTPASIINAIVALLASGGSTNHTLHIVAIAKAAGIQLTWREFQALSEVVPLLVRVYPNGQEDVNAFQRAGGTAFLIKELRRAGLLNDQVKTIMGEGLSAYECPPMLSQSESIEWDAPIEQTKWDEVLRPTASPFAQEGGLRVLAGNLGEAVSKVSAVKPEHQSIKAPCVIFHDQDSLKLAFENGELEKDFIAVVRFQGPQANGMPELHNLSPYLGTLQDRGFKVALVTDGRMSGASGKVPSAIHVSPEAYAGGDIAKLRDGDVIEFDATTGVLEAHVDAEVWATRECISHDHDHSTLGRNLFSQFRASVGAASLGASVFDFT